MRLLRRAPAAVVCALAAHALVYRTAAPSDGLHGYFAWYEPAVAAASLACLAGLVVLLAGAAVARRLRRPLRRRVGEPQPLAAGVRSLAVASLAVYLVQETLERSVALGHPSVPVLAPSQAVALLAGIAAASLVLCLALHVGHAALRRVLGGSSAAARGSVAAWSLRVAAAARPRALAGRFALRAPPLLAR